MDNSYSAGTIDDVLRNVELRTELEPYTDESVSCVECHNWTITEENKYLTSLLKWEQAPILPIYQWFEPEIAVPALNTLSPGDLSEYLRFLAQKLFEKHIALDFTDHLNDVELYWLIVKKILPIKAKKIDDFDVYQHWDCSRPNPCVGNPMEEAWIWLTYYANDEQRNSWAELYGEPLPEKKVPLYHRDFPRDDSLNY